MDRQTGGSVDGLMGCAGVWLNRLVITKVCMCHAVTNKISIIPFLNGSLGDRDILYHMHNTLLALAQQKACHFP